MLSAPLPLLALALLLLAGCRTPESTALAPESTPMPAASLTSPPPQPQPQPALSPHDAFVLLSGGGTPTSNNYSQYVQARAVSAFLRERYPADAVWTFFGVGNREGEPPLLADVYRQIKDDNLLLDTWLPGSLPANRPATREAFLAALRTEILPRVRGGGTLYLFVGDHGELTTGKTRESAITMWGLKHDPDRPNGWTTQRNYALTVTELRQALTEGIGSGRVVFAMTQCHSGGFHDLGSPVDLQPPAGWFLTAPNWLRPEPKLPLAAAGFTATDAATIAAGCDPSPDPDSWFGYERFLPEKLLGRDLLSSRTLSPRPLASFAAAHEAAVLVDHTLDKPRSTSEHYLDQWATLIETKLAHELLLTPRARAALEAYQSAVETGLPAAQADPAWRETRARFDRYQVRMVEQNPALRSLLSGKRSGLAAAIAGKAPRTLDPVDDDSAEVSLSRRQIQAWRDTLRPAWVKAVAAREVPALPAAALPFELRLQSLDTRRPVGFGDEWSGRSLDELYWFSTYAKPSTHDAATARAVTHWAVQRRAVILAWAASASAPVHEAAADFPAEFRRPRRPESAPSHVAIASDTAAARTLFYRRVLAAWSFLLVIEHQPALTQLKVLRALERTPLPASGNPPSPR
ncbi:MAG: hypothetical protein V4773_16825 [Verrucomicrobiota bacterium]